eukprot:2677194-Pleurochrysis_carterae.AAC.3
MQSASAEGRLVITLDGPANRSMGEPGQSGLLRATRLHLWTDQLSSLPRPCATTTEELNFRLCDAMHRTTLVSLVEFCTPTDTSHKTLVAFYSNGGGDARARP